MSIQVHLPHGFFGVGPRDPLLSRVIAEVGVAAWTANGKETGWADPNKYGHGYENATFLMHQYCWCEKDDCLWCIGGDEPEFIQKLAARFGTTPDGYYDKATGYCDPPHFWYKPTDFRVIWYKYIGRDMATNRKATLDELMEIRKACLDSLVTAGATP